MKNKIIGTLMVLPLLLALTAFLAGKMHYQPGMMLPWDEAFVAAGVFMAAIIVGIALCVLAVGGVIKSGVIKIFNS